MPIPLHISALGPETAWIYPLFRHILNSILRGHRATISGAVVYRYHPCSERRFKAFSACLQGFREGEAKETVTCSREDSGHTCSDDRNETRRGGSIDEGKGAVAGGGVGGGKPNEVLSPKEAEKWGKKIGEVKKNAAPMNKLTKNQMKAQSAMGPPAPKK